MRFRKRSDIVGFAACVTGFAVVAALMAGLLVAGPSGGAAAVRQAQARTAAATVSVVLPLALLIGGLISRRSAGGGTRGRQRADSQRV